MGLGIQVDALDLERLAPLNSDASEETRPALWRACTSPGLRDNMHAPRILPPPPLLAPRPMSREETMKEV